jgi:hypothetical protein
MPLTFSTPPADAFTALTSGLQAVNTAQQHDPRGGGSLALPATPMVTKPHPVYSLGLDDLAAGKGLESAQLVAWRYLVVENNQIRQAAEVIPDPGGGSRFSTVTTGFIAGAEQAFAQAEKLPEVVAGNYEIRALQAPAVYVMALWLKDLNGTQDRFILLPPVLPPLQSGTVYNASDLLSVLQQKAARKQPLEQQVVAPKAPAKPRP